MLFNSIDFLVFFPIVVLLFFITNEKNRWAILLVASYIFYMFWSPMFIVLIILSTLVDYYCGLRMSDLEDKKRRKPYLVLSLCTNIGLLFTFKYMNFVTGELSMVAQSIDSSWNFTPTQLILPMGISFYTFQTLSYSIDVYNGRVKAEKHLGIFALFVSYFPQLVAGPIERAKNLLPGLRANSAVFDYERVVLGLRQMGWGFFKKLLIADRLAPMVNEVYNDPTAYSGIPLTIATILFAFQIYCDFSGYSDIAIGAARVMGIDLMKNFNSPYFANSFRDFWKRWHISLSSWFRDYVYIPIGGNRGSMLRWFYAIFITFLLSGFWHGANWTFIAWGALHAVYLILEKFLGKFITYKENRLNSFLMTVMTFFLVCFAWIFFRASTISDAFFIATEFYKGWSDGIILMLNDKSKIVELVFLKENLADFLITSVFLVLMILVELKHSKTNISVWLSSKPIGVRWSIYMFCVIAILLFGAHDSEVEFIYFQF